MANNPNETLCIKCGQRGFRHITHKYNTSMSVPALECLNNDCKSIIYEHEGMVKIQAEREQTATK